MDEDGGSAAQSVGTRARPRGGRSADPAAGDIYTLRMSHAQTARHAQAGFKVAKGGREESEPTPGLRYQVLLALLALRVLGLGARDGHLPRVPSVFQSVLEGVQVLRLQVKHSVSQLRVAQCTKARPRGCCLLFPLSRLYLYNRDTSFPSENAN